MSTADTPTQEEGVKDRLIARHVAFRWKSINVSGVR